MTNQKSLSVYYSRKGNNYVSGSIVNLPVGNTEVIAKKIRGRSLDILVNIILANYQFARKGVPAMKRLRLCS